MKIKTAFLHQPVAVPGVMAPNTTINTIKVPGIKLRWENDFGLIWGIRTQKGEPREGFFPTSTVSVVETEAGTFWKPDDKGVLKAA